MEHGNEQIYVANCTGRYKGRLNFSILISWVLTIDGEFRVGDEFKIPSFAYFEMFEVNSEFNYHDTCDPTSIYRLRLLRHEDGSVVLRIQRIFHEQGDEWLYQNRITYGDDYGVIEFLGVNRRPDLKLIKCL